MMLHRLSFEVIERFIDRAMKLPIAFTLYRDCPRYRVVDEGTYRQMDVSTK